MDKKQASVFLKICSIILSVITCNNLFSQPLNYTLNRDYLWGFDNYYNNKDQNFQNFVKPYRYTDIKLISDSTAECPLLLKKEEKPQQTKKKSALEISPVFSAVAGYQPTSSSRFTNDLAIGGNLSMNLGEKFALNLKAFTGRVISPAYTDSVIKETRVIPGIGYAYRINNDSINTQYAYEYYSGYLSYSPNKIFNIQLGQDKHFLGDGYRSLFLSDVSAPYPYLKITSSVWHLTYVNLYTIMKDVTNPSGFKKDWLTKYATFHYLGWNVTKRINIGLFESIVWQGTDSTRYRGYDVNYLNPVMFFRPTEYSLGSSDNAFVGFSFKIKLFRKQQLYGQLVLDEFLLKEVKADLKYFVTKDTTIKWGWWANKQAFQIGFKSFDLFKIKQLNFQTEFNYVRPYTYSHGSVQENYGHMNQPLAHPLGANFMESATFLNYRYKRLFIEAKCVFSVYGGDSASTDYGKNIFISYNSRSRDYGNYNTQGFQTHLITTSLRAAYIIDARVNLKIELGAAYRIEQNDYSSKNTPFVFIGIRTDLCNLYDDF